jgi:transposase
MALSPQQIPTLEPPLLATVQEGSACHRLPTVPGSGTIVAPTIPDEIGQMARFQEARECSSSCRVVPGGAQSGPVSRRGRHAKPGSPHLKWAFSQAAPSAVRYHPKIRRDVDRHLGRHRGNAGERIASNIMAQKLAQAVYHVRRDGTVYREGLRCGT